MHSRFIGLLGATWVVACSVTWAQNVKITSLGSHSGELCMRDRATIFEDPTGVRILYDAGQSVTGGDDPRLGRIDVVILSHAHGDHIGDMRLKAVEGGTCDSPPVVSAAPNSTTAEIVAAKNAAVIMVVPLANFIGCKVETIRGKPTTACPQTGGDLIAPLAAPCLATVQTGGSRTVKASLERFTEGAGCALFRRDEDGSYVRTETTLASAPERVTANDQAVLAMLANDKAFRARDSSSALGAELALSMAHRGELFGFVLLGLKEDGEPYRPDQIEVLEFAVHEGKLDFYALQHQQLATQVALERRTSETLRAQLQTAMAMVKSGPLERSS